MAEFKYIPQSEIFNCSVELSGAKKFYVLDGKQMGFSANDGVIEIPSEGDLLTQVIFVRTTPHPLSYKVRIRCSAGSSRAVILCAHTTGTDRYVTEESVEIAMEENSNLSLIVMQNENGASSHHSTFDISQKSSSNVSMNIITLHGGNIANRVNCLLNGKRAEAQLSGLYLAGGEQNIDTTVNLRHNSGECTSNQLFKGILGGNARTSFKGEVYVAKDSQKTEAYQANNNLLISDTARAISDPHLVIYADDVKCSHGSTVGSLADEELFYMRSRGISESEAKLLQQQAFAGAVLEKISNTEIRERLSRLVERRLRGEDTLCAGCAKRCC